MELLQSEIERTREYFRYYSSRWWSYAEKGSSLGEVAFGGRMAASYAHLAQEVDRYIDSACTVAENRQANRFD